MTGNAAGINHAALHAPGGPSELSPSLIGAAPDALPSYAPSHPNRYDAARNGYNWKASNTRRLRASLAKANAGIDQCHVAIGDSLTAGCTNGSTLTFDRTHAWPRRYAEILATLGVPSAGTGIVRIIDGVIGVFDARFTFTGAWSSAVTYSYSTASGRVATFTTDKAGNGVRVVYSEGPGAGSFTVSVNGASSGAGFTTVPNNVGTVATWKTVTLAGVTLAAGDTVAVTSTSAAVTPIYGVEVFTAGGLAVHNLGLSSSTASGTGRGSWSDLSDANQNLSIATSSGIYVATPAVVHCTLGVNDLNAGAAPSTVVTALTTIRNAFPASDFVLHAASQFSTVTLATWTPYVATLYSIADTLDVPLLDMQDRYGGYTSLAGLGLAGDTNGHMTSGGYADWGRNAALSAAA